MSFVELFSGDYVVWHGVPAQIDVHVDSPMASFNRCDLVVGVNKDNSSPQVRVYSRDAEGAAYVLATGLSPVVMPTLPSDGSFVDVTYSGSFDSRIATDVRIVIERQEMIPVKKYLLFDDGSLTTTTRQYRVNDLGWQTGGVFGTIFKYLDAPISSEHRVDVVNETSGLLPESRISNDGVLARMDSPANITSFWSFERGQIVIEKGDELPTENLRGGRLFNKGEDLYLADGTKWNRMLKAADIENRLGFSVWFMSDVAAPGECLKCGGVMMTATEGLPIVMETYLAAVTVKLSTMVAEPCSIEILRNGEVVGEIPIEAGAKSGVAGALLIGFSTGDMVAVRAKPENTVNLDVPRVAMLFRPQEE